MLGLDFGTQSAKGVIVKSNGNIAASAYYPYQIICNNLGWVEQNPEDWWQALKNICIQLKRINISAFSAISAVGFSGQMHGVIFMGNSGEILRNAIIWLDNRAIKECNIINDILNDEDKKIISNPITPVYSAPKILWVRENEEEVWRQVKKILFLKDYIRYRMCGSIFTDPSDASGTLLFNFNMNSWDEEILSKLQINPHLLPEIIKSSEICGKISFETSMELGLKCGTPIVTGGGDLACGLLGSGVVTNNIILITLGTAGQVMMLKDNIESKQIGKLYYFKNIDGEKNFSLGSLNSAGYCLRWFMDNLCEMETYAEKKWELNGFKLLDMQAMQSNIGANGLLFLPYLQGTGTPYMDKLGRGAFIGLGGYHTKKDIVRSLMEGVILGIRDSVDLIKYSDIITHVRFAGGGSKSLLWNKILADVLGCNVTTLSIKDASPYGAALIAGKGVGIYRNLNEAASLVKIQETIEPNVKNVYKYEKLYSIYKKLYKSLKRSFAEIANFNIDNLS